MRSPRPNPKLVKIHRSYTVEEAAALCGVHRNTVRQWLRSGLPSIDERKPLLILGRSLAEFLHARRALNKRPCKPGEIYCMRCREPRQPAGLDAIYRPRTVGLGDLIGLCQVCTCRMYRRVNFTNLASVRGQLRITMPEAWEHIGDSASPSENSDVRQEPPDHAKTQP